MIEPHINIMKILDVTGVPRRVIGQRYAGFSVAFAFRPVTVYYDHLNQDEKCTKYSVFSIYPARYLLKAEDPLQMLTLSWRQFFSSSLPARLGFDFGGV